MAHQALREFAFDLVSFEVVVQLRDFVERVGREEPDFSGVRIVDADQDDGNVPFAVGEISDGLLIEGAELGTAFAILAELSGAAHERRVHQLLQLFRDLWALRLAAYGAHLQVICCGLEVPSLCNLQESEYGS